MTDQLQMFKQMTSKDTPKPISSLGSASGRTHSDRQVSQTILPFGQDLVPANPFHQQGEEQAQQTNDSAGPRSDRISTDNDTSAEMERPVKPTADATHQPRCCETGPLADSSTEGLQGWLPERTYSERQGQHGHTGCSDTTDRPNATNGYWADPDWLYCRDDKWRPAEPSTFPLAHGATNRVGRLRGYGNAIVAPQAQAFIEAVMA